MEPAQPPRAINPAASASLRPARLLIIASLIVSIAASAGVFAQERPAPSAPGFRQPDAAAFPDLFVWTDSCNVYVLRDGDAATLIDFGNGDVLDHLSEIGVKRVAWVLLTHHHREQCQGIGRIDRSVTKVAAPESEREFFENPADFRKWFPALRDKFSVYGASYVRPPAKAVPIDRGLNPGEAFAWRGLEILCLDTPGHSPGGMSYLIRRGAGKVAFTGGVMHDGSKMTTWFDTEWDYGFGKGIDTLILSVERLIGQDIDIILPSHGPTINEPRTQLNDFLGKLERFRSSYVRGYETGTKERDFTSKPTAFPLINQVTPHLYKLNRDYAGKNFSIIISDNGRGLILDAGLFPELILHRIIRGMRDHLGLKEIDALWISHMHGDHFLHALTLKEEYGVKLWTLDLIADKCENPRNYDYVAPISAYPGAFDGIKIDKVFRDGEVVEWEGYRIQVDWMPGQTEFGCCLWLELDGKKIAFTGDNIFANPADEREDGHEAVVARNSGIFEQGYFFAAQYLKKLEPDLIMGSHSYVMDDPAGLIDRYYAWGEKIIAVYEDLLPDEDYEYLFDPYWVSAYPYRVDFSEEDTQTVTITVRNFRDSVQRHRIALKLPPGLEAEPAVLEGTVEPESRRSFKVKLTAERDDIPAGVRIVPLDIRLDGNYYGEMFDFLIRAHADEG